MSSLVLTEDQEEIRRTARAFVQERAPVTHMRELRGSPVGFSRELWRDLAGLGVVGLLVPESYGGAGLGLAELGLVLEELGRNLVPTPMLSTVVLGTGVLAAGSPAQRQAWLPGIAAGEKILALAHEEGARHAPWTIATRAERTPGGFKLSGAKSFVLDGHVADALVVVARGADESLTLFLVPAERAGVSRHRLDLVDGRNAARLSLEGVEVSEAEVIGKPGEAALILQPVLDRACAALAAEMFGGLCAAFETTVAYLKVRKQFGVPIGSFQALKHRAAHMFCEVELCRSIVLESLRALDEQRPDASLLASAAKARLSDAFVAISAEAIQMHGGIGVTDELDVGLYYKRARVAEMTLGGASFHKDRFAKLRGH